MSNDKHRKPGQFEIRNTETGCIALINESQWGKEWNKEILQPPTWVKVGDTQTESATPKNQEDEPSPEVFDVLTKEQIEELSWTDVKSYAAQHGINTRKKKRNEIVKELDDMGAIATVGDIY